MAHRKTIHVARVRELGNTYLRLSSTGDKEGRYGVVGLLEQVLMETDNYHGFNYLDSEFVADPSEVDPNARSLRDDYDDSRRKYY